MDRILLGLARSLRFLAELAVLLHLQGLPDFGGVEVFCIVPSMPAAVRQDSEFAEIQREIEEIVSKLRSTHDPEVRRRLFRQMRVLLGDADKLLD